MPKQLLIIRSPLDGFQIMGLLETRTLDFENLIITSLNEGVLPGGKSQNSFLPHELKIKNNLPTYREKDAFTVTIFIDFYLEPKTYI